MKTNALRLQLYNYTRTNVPLVLGFVPVVLAFCPNFIIFIA